MLCCRRLQPGDRRLRSAYARRDLRSRKAGFSSRLEDLIESSDRLKSVKPRPQDLVDIERLKEAGDEG